MVFLSLVSMEELHITDRSVDRYAPGNALVGRTLPRSQSYVAGFAAGSGRLDFLLRQASVTDDRQFRRLAR